MLKLADFGFGKAISSPPSISDDHSFVGTLFYLAADALYDPGRLSPFRTDVFALGLTFVETLGGGETGLLAMWGVEVTPRQFANRRDRPSRTLPPKLLLFTAALTLAQAT